MIRPTRLAQALAPFALALFALSCGQAGDLVETGPTACADGTARITVGDSFLRGDCGCTEGDGIEVAAGTPLTCTVGSGTQVIFSYLAAFTPHQITSTGPEAFVSSPPSHQGSQRNVPVYGVTLTSAGNYGFQDAVLPGLSGTIVVTP